MTIVFSILLLVAIVVEILTLLAQLGPLPDAAVTGISTFLNLARAIDNAFPVGTLLVIIGLVVAIEIVMLKFGLVTWIGGWLRGRSSSAGANE